MPQYEYGITELPKGYVEIESERTERPVKWELFAVYLNDIQMRQGGASDLVAKDVEIIPVMVNGLDGRLLGRADWGMSRTRSHELIQIVVCNSIPLLAK